MSNAIIVPKDFWPRPGEMFECESTRVERHGNRFDSVPNGVHLCMTLQRYTTSFAGSLTWVTERGTFYAKGAASRYGWDATKLQTYALPLPYWVLISAFDRWHPTFAAEALGLPRDSFPDIDYQKRYPCWCSIYLKTLEARHAVK